MPDDAAPWPADAVERRPIAELIPNARNARTHSDAQVAQLAGSIREWGWTIPVLVDEDGTLIAGHGRVLAGLLLGLETVPTMVAAGWSDAKKRAYMLADNKLALNAGWDEDLLRSELGELLECGLPGDLMGFDEGELRSLLGDLDTPTGSGALAARFGAVPFTVLNAREGTWQARKRGWLACGIQSELGRTEDVLFKSQGQLDALKKRGQAKAAGTGFTGVAAEQTMAGTSIFDPVLCELAYRWFSPPGGQVLDPFAGGSVRGVVAAKLGRPYYGIDLGGAQVAANAAQWEDMAAAAALEGQDQAPAPVWVQGDSLVALDAATVPAADFVFSCPPYANLEVYSDDPADISNMPYEAFLEAYRGIIAKACAHLKDDRFAAWVVGEIRNEVGHYRNFTADTVAAFAAAGLAYYNEAILVTMVGTLPIRAGKQFAATRKLGKTHQNVLIFLKGDARRAVEACGEVEVGDLDDALLDEDDADGGLVVVG